MKLFVYGLAGALIGAILCGLVGFSIGFFGPMIFMPESNIGPLMGIIETGPLGVVVGLIGGMIWGLRRASGHGARIG